MEFVRHTIWFEPRPYVNKDGSQQLLMRITCEGKNYYIGLPIRLMPGDWGKKGGPEHGRHVEGPDHPQGKKINKGLSELRERVSDYINSGGIIDRQAFNMLARAKEAITSNTPLYKWIMEMARRSEVLRPQSKGQLKKNTLAKMYVQVAGVIAAFEKWRGRASGTMDLDQGWYVDWTRYCNVERNYKHNNTAKLTRFLRTCLYAAIKEGYQVHPAFKDWKLAEFPVTQIYLSIDELRAIAALDLDNREDIRQARDLFLVGAYTGQRYSDYSRLSKKDIQGDVISIVPQKTSHMGRRVKIPVLPQLREILDRYPDGIPVSRAEQVFNRNIKEICRLAGLTQEISIVTKRAGTVQESSVAKFNLVSSHTARRSFATNAYLAGVPVQTIMAITGHTTHASFMKYIVLDREDHAKLFLGLDPFSSK